jgi:hypothetical protein
VTAAEIAMVVSALTGGSAAQKAKQDQAGDALTGALAALAH